MFDSMSQILPSLAALGGLAYWGIGLAAGLEAFVLTGIFLPGTLFVDAGGVMVQRGLLDFLDLVWFVAIGSVLGGEATFWVGRHLRQRLSARWKVEDMAPYARARQLFARHGGAALVIGRFLGPVAAFVPLVAALSGMETRRFRLWNIASGLPYAIGHVGFGYVLGLGVTQLPPVLMREALVGLALGAAALGLWWSLRRLDRALPVVLEMLGGLMDRIAGMPRADAFGARHPRLARLIASRMDRSHFLGLPATLLGIGFVYLLGLGAGIAFDFAHSAPIVQIDARLAQLMHALWTPGLVAGFTVFTALGDVRVVAALLVLALMWLALARRWALIAGLLSALGADLVSVGLLKLAFERPRSALGYFVETSGSFPSGHATVSVAFYAMLFYILWRVRCLGPVTAAFWAVAVAFLIGLSRLFLVEHYLSDVLAGWVLGALCLMSGIAVTEWRQLRHPPAPRPVRGMAAAAAALASVLLIGGAGLRLADYSKALNPRPPETAPTALSAPEEIFTRYREPDAAVTLSGEHRFALNIAFAAPSRAALESALHARGWTVARPVTVPGLARSALDALSEDSAPDAAPVPLFWNERANDLALSLTQPAPDQTAGTTPRMRLWQSRFVLADGRRLWLGVLRRDDGLDLDEGSDGTDVAEALAQAMGAGTRQIAPGTAPLPLIGVDTPAPEAVLTKP